MIKAGKLFKLGLTAALATVLTACGPEKQAQGTAAAEQQTYKWKMVTSWPKNFPGLGTAPERFSKMVDEMSNGRL